MAWSRRIGGLRRNPSRAAFPATGRLLRPASPAPARIWPLPSHSSSPSPSSLSTSLTGSTASAPADQQGHKAQDGRRRDPLGLQGPAIRTPPLRSLAHRRRPVSGGMLKQADAGNGRPPSTSCCS